MRNIRRILLNIEFFNLRITTHNIIIHIMSVLRYPGGKTRAIKIFEQYIPKDTTEIVSPFFGGGSFELYLNKTKNIKIYANDKFTPLVNFWKCLKRCKEELIKEIKKLRPLTKEKFLEIREKLKDDNLEVIKQASYYFAVNRSSFSGSTCSGGFSKESAEKRFTESSISRLEEMKLKNVKFYNEDFEDFIISFENNEFMFLDPPYYLEKGNRLYGKGGDLHSNFKHKKLYKLLKKRTNWMLCYNDCEFIRNLYKKFKIKEVDWNYGMNKSKKSSEIIIFSKT
jgi:DNA adenine methylase